MSDTLDETTPNGKEISRSDYSVGWIAVHLECNAARPQDMIELLEAAIEMIRQEYTAKAALRFDGGQPFLIEDIVVDTANGIVTVYFNWNDVFPWEKPAI